MTEATLVISQQPTPPGDPALVYKQGAVVEAQPYFIPDNIWIYQPENGFFWQIRITDVTDFGAIKLYEKDWRYEVTFEEVGDPGSTTRVRYFTEAVSQSGKYRFTVAQVDEILNRINETYGNSGVTASRQNLAASNVTVRYTFTDYTRELYDNVRQSTLELFSATLLERNRWLVTAEAQETFETGDGFITTTQANLPTLLQDQYLT